MSSATQAARLYRGLSPSDRHAQRREQLLQAGLEVFGTEGYAKSSIRAVCAAASLNSRYFYESFTSREDLLYHVYKRTIREVASAVVKATAQQDTIQGQVEAGLRASWISTTEDRRKAKVIAVEVIGVSERLERLRRENRRWFADLLVQNSRLITGGGVEYRMDPVLTSRSLMGAVVDMLGDWVNGEVDASVEEIVDHFIKLFTAVAYASAVHDTTACPPRRARGR